MPETQLSTLDLRHYLHTIALLLTHLQKHPLSPFWGRLGHFYFAHIGHYHFAVTQVLVAICR